MANIVHKRQSWCISIPANEHGTMSNSTKGHRSVSYNQTSFRHALFALVGFSTVLHLSHIRKSTSFSKAGSPTFRFERAPEGNGSELSQVGKTRNECRNRVLFSSFPVKQGDGLGHRILLVNFEISLARKLGVGYAHRVGSYGSLTPRDDPLAVEQLFGWDVYPDKRDALMRTACSETKVWETTESCKSHPVCTKLRSNGPFKHLVHIPGNMTNCFVRSGHRKACREQLSDLAEQHNKDDTIFQMLPSTCASKFTLGMAESEKAWFREQYWRRHVLTKYEMETPKMKKNDKATRILPFQADRMQIAVHIRRGDILVLKNRTPVPDHVYANVIAAVKKAADKEYGRDVKTSVHIYSEGEPDWFRSLNHHDVNKMKPVYLTENGTSIAEAGAYWKQLVQRRLTNSSEIQMQAHIASDTLLAIHAMICSDVFIGSLSGLSSHIVSNLNRGLSLLPMKKNNKNRKEDQERDTRVKLLRFDVMDGLKVDEEALRNGIRRSLGNM